MLSTRERLARWTARYGEADRTIVIPLYDGFTTLDVMGPFDVLTRVPGVEVVLAAKAPGPVAADVPGLTVLVEHALSDMSNPHVLVVPGGSSTPGLLRDDDLLAWLRDAATRATVAASVCTGALLLGAAGLLRGRRATTHWFELPRLRDYGATPVAERVVTDGPIMTGAGVSAGIDLALELARHLTDAEFAEAIQLSMEYDPRPPFRGSPETVYPEILAGCEDAYRRMYQQSGFAPPRPDPPRPGR
jgi:transcriptional regulator GlxA family with amidase domain